MKRSHNNNSIVIKRRHISISVIQRAYSYKAVIASPVNSMLVIKGVAAACSSQRACGYQRRRMALSHNVWLSKGRPCQRSRSTTYEHQKTSYDVSRSTTVPFKASLWRFPSTAAIVV
ncbi:hypothetical protein AVEN_144663-1 [Araneus ventricosus]|uniref:Uncharacterized protein n=1 Tax=Araneus ventricosus TaxID=182803 RepID=A0A4Y2DZP5_ARAVE|nr:hypothetical protein AVEN_144663-1 [Araneus ventricosus]